MSMKLRKRIQNQKPKHVHTIATRLKQKSNKKIKRSSLENKKRSIKFPAKTKKIKKNTKVSAKSIKERQNNFELKKILQNTVKRVQNLEINSLKERLRAKKPINKTIPFKRESRIMKRQLQSKTNTKSKVKTKSLSKASAKIQKAKQNDTINDSFLFRLKKMLTTLNNSKLKRPKSSKPKRRSNSKHVKARIIPSIKSIPKKQSSVNKESKTALYNKPKIKRRPPLQRKLKIQTKKNVIDNDIDIDKLKLNDDSNVNQKTISQLQTLQTRYNKRLYLKSINITYSLLKFQIVDQKFAAKTVSFDKQKISCSCFDFRSMRQACEHVLFVVKRILRNEQLQHHLKYKTEIQEHVFHKINEQIIKMFYKEKVKQEEDNSQEEQQIVEHSQPICQICYQEKDQLQQAVQDQKTSKKYHKKCYELFKNHKLECPPSVKIDFQTKSVQEKRAKVQLIKMQQTVSQDENPQFLI